MEKSKIIAAIERARMGIRQYLAIMDLFPIVDVSIDRDFQRQFNAFYRIRQRPEKWYAEYYSFMEGKKTAPVRFEEVLDHLNDTLGKYAPSFSSKLAATLDPNEPVWDKYVLQNTGQTAPSYSAGNKMQRAKEVFRRVREWYSEQMKSQEGQLIVAIFDDLVEEHDRITDLKKIDFVLWQSRG